MPNRIIKESVCTSENLNNLTCEEEVFFYRLLVNCDDYGRTDGRTQVIRARCYPLRLDKVKDKDIEKWLKSLIKENLIFMYQSNGQVYIQMKTWDKHQQIRAKRSKYPDPNTEETYLISDDINGNQKMAHVTVIQSNPIQSESNPNPIDNRGNTPKFTPPSLEEVQSYCKERNNKVDAGKWYDFYSAKGWMIGKNKMKDWKAAVRTWEKSEKPDTKKPSGWNREDTRDWEEILKA